MSNKSFGDYIRNAREAKNLQLRKVAAYLDIDTSTLSRLERCERAVSPENLKTIAYILQIYLKEIQTKFIADKTEKDFGDMEHLSD